MSRPWALLSTNLASWSSRVGSGLEPVRHLWDIYGICSLLHGVFGGIFRGDQLMTRKSYERLNYHKMSQKFSCAVGGQQNAICGADDSMINGNTFVFCQCSHITNQIPNKYSRNTMEQWRYSNMWRARQTTTPGGSMKHQFHPYI